VQLTAPSNDFMGRSVQRSLTDYIDSGDTSHVVAVWQPGPAGPGGILVTGAVHEWADLRRPVKPAESRDRLSTWFYAFHAVPGELDLATLPFADASGRPLRLLQFLEVLREQARPVFPQADLVITNKQHEWHKALQNRHLDPEIFRTQKQMNHVEGGVEDLFRFPAAKDFIDFLLDLTTQPEAAGSIATRLTEVAEQLAAKPGKMSERDFCSAAAGDLDVVAGRHEKSTSATAELARAETAAGKLAAAFASSVAEADGDLTCLAGQREAIISSRTKANNERSQANDLLYLYRREAARLRLDEARNAEEKATRRSEELSALARAWDIAQKLAALAALTSALDQVEIEAAAEEDELKPLRAEHGRHAARLRARLLELADEADFTADLADEQRATTQQAADNEGKLADQARAEHGQATSDESRARTWLELFDGRRDDGVRAGHLPALDTPPAKHLETVKSEHGRLAGKLDEITGRTEGRRVRRAEIAGRETELAGRRSEANGQRAAASATHSALSERLAGLAGNPRLRELVEASEDEPIDLWSEEPVLRRRLSDAILAADEERVSRRAQQHADRRTIEAQERDQVLPSSLDAERIQRELAPKVTAQTGWAYLRSVLPPGQLRPALERPAVARLGCGVVVPTASATDAAGVLEGGDVRTTSLVAVYTAQAADVLLSSTTFDAVTPVWTGLEPGLVDPVEAAAAARLLKERAAAYQRKDHELARQRDADDELMSEVARFTADCPHRYLDVLRRDINRLDDCLRDIEAEQGANKVELEELDEADRRDDDEKATTQKEQGTLDITIAWLNELIPALLEEPDWQGRLSDAVPRGRDAHDRAETHAAEQLRLAGETKGFEAAARTERDRASGYRSEGAGVPDSDNFTDASVESGIPLDTLRKNQRDALKALESRAAQSVLADRVIQLRHRVADTEGEIDGHPEEDRVLAAQLLASPDGQEPHLRRTALESARIADRDAATRLGTATGVVRQRQAELTAIQQSRDNPPRRALPSVPESAAEADALAGEQEKHSSDLQVTITQVEEKIKEIQGQADRIENRQRMIGALLDSLPDPDPGSDTAEPFHGTEKDARERAKSARDQARAASDKAADAESRLKAAVDQLRRGAARFPAMTGPVKDRVVNDSVEVLGPGASELAAKLRLRAQTLADELDSIAKDQVILSEGLAYLVKESLDVLGRAEHGSQMGAASGSWAGKRILRIGFDRPDDADLVAYSERVIDRTVQKRLKPEGMPLLKAAVHEAAGPRGFTVKVLKPSDDTSVTTEDISRLAKWSGGEKLTVCVALYCTLAALRATQTGRSARSGGVLLLDNPIGRASTPYLVRLQRDVAASHGIQLIVTTGVKDPAAVIQFPNVVRLDNREGRMHNRRYIVPDNAHSTDGLVGEVTGIRVAHADHTWRTGAAEQERAL
jgi:hypothetical protein